MKTSRTSAGRLAGFAAILAGFIVSPVFGQTSGSAGPYPFLPPGLAGDPEKLLEQMFGKSTPEEEQALSAVNVSFAEELAFGQPQVEAFQADLAKRRLRVVRKGRDVDYLARLIETIQPMMSDPARYKRFNVAVIDSPDVDARSFPGGSLFFCRGLLASAETEAAVVGVVGHELSHLDRGHLLLPLKRSRLLEQQLGAGFDPPQFFARGTTMMRLMSRPFRPEDETAADRDGAAWAYRAGYDPRELAALLDRLHRRQRTPKLPFASLFRTHPYHDDRCAAILKLHDELQRQAPRDPLYRGEQNLRQRVPKSQQEFPE